MSFYRWDVCSGSLDVWRGIFDQEKNKRKADSESVFMSAVWQVYPGVYDGMDQWDSNREKFIVYSLLERFYAFVLRIVDNKRLVGIFDKSNFGSNGF